MEEHNSLKILYILQILMEETDRDHILNGIEICRLLEERYGIECSRKTIYSHIGRLKQFGIKIGQMKGNSRGYYIRERQFELPELKLLVDAVQASRFITHQKSEELIGKLETLTSRHNARSLQRQVFIHNRAKAGNETIYLAVDVIHTAMLMNRQICFGYCEWTPEKKMIRKRQGAIYRVSPWSLTWNHENYYLVGYDGEAGKIKHYRVDKMRDTGILGQARLGREIFAGFDLASYTKKTFGMYGGQDRKVTLRCQDRLAGVVLDRFGSDIIMIPDGRGYFRAPVTVSVSRQFFGWVTGVGLGMEIQAPASVREEYRLYLREILSGYEEESDGQAAGD